MDEVVKVYLDVLKKYPAEKQTLTKIVVPAASKSTKEGLEVVEIAEVEKERLAEALMYAAKVMIEFRHIDGYFYEISTLLKPEEGLETLNIIL
jgi:hypothetical protein